jgi:hypothetical protein
MKDNRDIQGLNKCLEYSDNTVRGRAMGALVFLAIKGIVDTSSVPLLNKLLKEPNNYLREWATIVLKNLADNGVSDASSVPLLNQLLNSPDNKVRANTVETLKALAKNGVFDASSVPLLIQVLKVSNKNEGGDAAETLGILGEKGIIDKESNRLLSQLLNDPEWAVKAVDSQINKQEKKKKKQGKGVELLLAQVISLTIPSFIDSNTMAEILVDLNNTSSTTLTDISLDISQLEEDFEVTGTIAVKTLSPGKALEQRIKIKPRYEKGTFPVKIIIMAKGARVTREYSIKVGGTEIY